LNGLTRSADCVAAARRAASPTPSTRLFGSRRRSVESSAAVPLRRLTSW
jgi:hypothetical protein